MGKGEGTRWKRQRREKRRKMGGGRGVRAGPGAAARALPPREGYVCPKTQAESPTRH